MKILVTGGAGFMGSHFIKHIVGKYPSYKVINFDKLTYAGNINNLKELAGNPNYKFIEGDIIDTEKLFEVSDGVDVIVNYAAETHVDRSIMDAYAFARTDVIGTMSLLEVVKQKKVERVIQISTDEVFGSIEKGSFTETSPFEPNSPYAASKAGGDLLCRAYWETYKTPVIVTHSCNFYGPNQYPEKIIPLFITNLLEGKKVPLYGDGLNIREWIFTKDHCEAIDLILHNGEIGEVYNIGSGEERTNKELTEIILRNLGKSSDSIEYVKDRPGHDRRYSLSSEKLRNKLGWIPVVNFESGIKETTRWYQENEWWWKPLKDGEYLSYYKKQYQDR